MSFRISIFVFLFASLLGASAPALAQDECKGSLSATYRGQVAVPDTELVDHVFAVEVQANVRCAKVDYVLRVVEEPREGGKVEKTKRYNQRVREGESKARIVKYRLDRGTLVYEYGFEVSGCTPCATP